MAVTPARRALAVLVPVAVLGALVACADDGDAGADDRGGGEAEQATPPPEQFTGSVEDFYVVPDPLPAGEPGDLIRVQQIEAAPGERGLRIMYHSTDANGDDRAVTGVVHHPTGPPPEGGWPVLAWAHGTSGIAPRCAPSRIPMVPNAYGVEGVRVAPDYVGLGPEGEVHPYLSAAGEGNAMVDGVRAVHQIDGAGAGDRWLVVGHSQGGHAALVTNEIAADAVPAYDLLGTVAIAPGAQFTETYGDEVPFRIITALVLFGGVDENPDIDPASYLSPQVMAAATPVMRDECLGPIIDALVPFAVSPDFYVQDPLDDEAARAWMEENDPGQVVSDSPLLLISGGRDGIVVPARTNALYDRLCDLGQVVQFLDLPEATHDSEPLDAADQISGWLADRLAGEPAPTTCA
ncbi:MAG TPA: lipase family protein [Acidimicrobiales bacterium]|nr:lipase family protein [Acidimicrobiales bacterium]